MCISLYTYVYLIILIYNMYRYLHYLSTSELGELPDPRALTRRRAGSPPKSQGVCRW